MPLRKHYNPKEAEPHLLTFWQEAGVYLFTPRQDGKVFSVDTPPATVSGRLHLGHTYSYTHPDLIARFRRMKGEAVFYPMGFDDNGLPTERLVERQMGVSAAQIGRRAFTEMCLQVSQAALKEYQSLWQRLGLSIDWRYTYRTIDLRSQRISQLSFLDLYQKGLVYRQKAPTIWCPECRTAIAQADVDDLERTSEFITLVFRVGNGKTLSIATTRPELLAACVAVFVHPDDRRYTDLTGEYAIVPLFGQSVPILADPAANPQKGTGAVMCCTFGDSTDKEWWYAHRLPLIEAIGRDGKLTKAAGKFAGLPLSQARQAITASLEENDWVLGRQPTSQFVRVHERCETPVEYIISQQWFIRVLDFKEALIQAGEKIRWHPEHMGARYRSWVENLSWDWCISRQRYFGIPFPVWFCRACGQVMLADEKQLPVDPLEMQPASPCPCGSADFNPEEDVLDTWATSSMTPQIVGHWPAGEQDYEDGLYQRVFPFSLRPQGHEIIRSWAFYTIAKSHFHFGEIPWKEVAISGWGIAGEGMGKISKSRGGGPLLPLEMIERYSADAVRYWAASTGLGKDAVISEDKIQIGMKLITKLWNIARFSEPFLEGYSPSTLTSAQAVGSSDSTQLAYPPSPLPSFTPADRWILSRAQQLIRRVTQFMEGYDYAAAKNEIENFFWKDLADNYLEMCKQRLYDVNHPQREATRQALYQVLLTTVKLLAPFLPYVTEEIYLGLFAAEETRKSGEVATIHLSSWPHPDENLEDESAEAFGELLVEIATTARRFKSMHNLALGTELERIQVASSDPRWAVPLQEARSDLMSVTRARSIEIVARIDPKFNIVKSGGELDIAILPD